MIKIVGFKQEDFEECSVKDVIRYFEEREYIQYDSETSGFDCYINQLLCFQIGDFENQFVISPDKLQEFKEFLETKTLIGQNIKFDLKFLYKNNIFPTKVWDTFLAESIIHCGIQTLRKNLATIAKRRLNLELDKSVRDNIWNKGLTKEVIEYSANDVKYLELIKNSQQLDLDKLNLNKALDIDNQFVLCLAYIEYSGFKLDVEAWKIKCKKDLEGLQQAEEKLNKYVLSNNLTKFITAQLDLFSTERTCQVNWGSSKQVIELFESLNIPVEIIEKGEKKKSVESKHIEKYKKEFPIIAVYLEFKEQSKLVSTYGNNFINQINPITGRLHTNFRQIMDTGRLSSGGKNKETGESYLNFQNIPSDKDTRNCFISSEGNNLIVCDYSGQEQVVLANKSMDKGLLQFYDEGLSDMHSFVASKMYPELERLTVDEIKIQHKDKRQEAKIAGFAINYGGVGLTIANQLNKSIEDGERVYNSYFKAFPDLSSYFNKVKTEGLKNGFILISEKTGRKSFVDEFQKYIDLNKEINGDFWDKWKQAKKDTSSFIYLTMKSKIKDFFKIKGAIERKSLNFPIQGESAEITKIAGIKMFQWIKDNNLVNKVLIPNVVHDEYILECSEELSELVAENLQKCMEEAGELFCTRVKLKAEPNISKKWTK